MPGVLDNGCVNINQWELDTKGPSRDALAQELLPPSTYPSKRCFQGKGSDRWGLDLYFQFSSVQSFSRVRLFETPWTAAHLASLSITNSQSLLKFMSIESVMPSNYLILYHPLLLLPSVFPNIRVFCNDLYSIVHIINKAKNKPQPATMSGSRQRVTASWQPCFWTSLAAVTKFKVALSWGYLLGHVPSLHPSGPPLPWHFQQFQGSGPSMPCVSVCLNWIYLGRLGTRPGLTQISPNLLLFCAS